MQILRQACGWLLASAHCSRLATFISHYGATSSIPLFILDTQHPYLLENRAALEALDAHQALCDRSSSLRNQLLQPIPDDLFSQLQIDNDRGDAAGILDRVLDWGFHWGKAEAVLSGIKTCSAALETCEELRVAIGISDYEESPEIPPPALIGALADVLESMPKLATIDWQQPTNQRATAAIEKTFAERHLRFPGLEKLRIGRNMHFLAAAAPNLKELEGPDDGETWSTTDEQTALVESIGVRSDLKNFSMEAGWSDELAGMVVKAMPGLESLSLRGAMTRWDYRNNDAIDGLLAVLKPLKSLRNLELPHPMYLGVGHMEDYGPMCGNAYEGLSGTQMGRQIARNRVYYVELVASLARSVLPQLTSLAIGGVDTEVPFDEEEDMKWPWTGRLGDYLLEQWPRYEGKNSNYWDGYDNTVEKDDAPIFGSVEEDAEILSDLWRPDRFARVADADMGYHALEDLEGQTKEDAGQGLHEAISETYQDGGRNDDEL